MKSRKLLSDLLFLFGLLIMLGVIGIAVLMREQAPQMLFNPSGAITTVEKMMTAFCDGDYATASSFIYGCPGLGSIPEDSTLAAELLWTEFRDSMEYEVSGDCYVRESGVSVDVTIKMLDVTSVIQDMETQAKELLGRRISAVSDISELYDSKNNFRQEIIDIVLRDAMMQSLADNRLYQEHRLTLGLTYEQGQWWILPDEMIWTALSGAF